MIGLFCGARQNEEKACLGKAVRCLIKACLPAQGKPACARQACLNNLPEQGMRACARQCLSKACMPEQGMPA